MAKITDIKWGELALKYFSFDHVKRDGSSVPVKVAIRPLGPLLMDRARVNAESYVDSLDLKEKASGTRDELLDDAREIECLALALMDPDKPDECWAGTAELRNTLTTAECGVLLRAYHDHQDAIGPNVRKWTDERFRSTLEAIAETESTDPLLFTDSHMQKSFTITTAKLLWSFLTEKSSTPSPVSSESSESKSSKSEADAAS